MRDAEFNPNELQKALLGYEPSDLEDKLIKWGREHWPMAARGMAYAVKEARDTMSGMPNVHSDEGKLLAEVSARIAIGNRDLVCRAIAAVLPDWLGRTYGLTPKDG